MELAAAVFQCPEGLGCDFEASGELTVTNGDDEFQCPEGLGCDFELEAKVADMQAQLAALFQCPEGLGCDFERCVFK